MEETIPDRCHVKAWAPDVPGLAEVFHAHLVDYAYPPHCHDRWTVLIIDHGAIRYDLDTRHCGAAGRTVAILPPGVVHDGGPANGTHDFRKRNLYLDGEFFPADLVGPAVDHTNIDDTELWTAIAALHETLAIDGDVLDAEARLALIGERITGHLIPRASPHRPLETPVADALREFLDAHAPDPVSLQHAADILERPSRTSFAASRAASG